MKKLVALSCFVVLAGCSSCEDDLVPKQDAGGSVDGGEVSADAERGDAGDLDASQPTDADSTDAESTDADSTDADSTDAGDGSNDGGRDGGDDASGRDAEPDAVVATCGDGTAEGDEACDDGNTDDGDYCSADCQTTTGSCGDGTLQSNESCDDGTTTDCATTHDGGDGACVPTGSCSSGYELDGNGDCVEQNATGLSTPCSNGAGQTLFKFHYDNGSTSARIDVWDASCSYSFANQACNVQEVYPGFGDLDRTSQGYPVCTSSEYIRVRYSVAGIPFTRATLYVQARSYATASSTTIEAWSPIYGSALSGLVDNDFVYDWYAIDWTNFVSTNDDPNLTAIQLYAYQGSNSLAVQGVELCLE